MEQHIYRIGELAEKCNVTVRTIRHYESLGLLKTVLRSPGGQRYYTDKEVVYLNRITELKELDFSLREIGDIIRLADEDSTGERRRLELLRQYRNKLSEVLERRAEINGRVEDLSWRIAQLESTASFQECPGLECLECTFKEKCRFKDS
jgi:DNA-binding transcriptional MerR regulator